jgi:streptogramin lyase
MLQTPLESAPGGRHNRGRVPRFAALAFGTALAFAGCATPAASPAGSAAAVPTASPASTAAAASATSTADAGLSGTWNGALVDPSGSYPAHLVLEDCTTVGMPCGELEYLDPGQDDVVMCASELTLTGREGDRFDFSERYVYRGWMCFTMTFSITRAAGGAVDVEQFPEPGVVCCRGTFAAHAGGPEPAPALPSIGGLGRATAITALGGATTQYAGVGAGSLWFPLEDRGAVARLDPATGAISAIVETGDPGSLEGMKSDPHSVAAGDAGIWVAMAADKAVGRIDPATSKIVESVPLSIIPYALAFDGDTLWVSSFEDDRVVRVDLATMTVVADVRVNKPTGIAVGLGGVWVVRHRDDVLVRIDPATNKVVADISLGERGPNETCGMCVENVIVSDGSVWTANNWGRSISRINPKTNKVAATIDLPLRPWTVAAGGGQVWASQFEGSPEGQFVDQPTWAVAAVDPATNEVTSFAFPGAFSVTWAGDALWVVMPGRRGDVVVRVELAPMT